jgi:hypothetical protein
VNDEQPDRLEDEREQYMQNMRRWGILLVLAMLATMIVAAPAAADPPVELTGLVTFEDVDPCDAPNTDIVTISWTLDLHEHANNTVYIVDSTVTTANGFVGNGHETTVVTGNNQLITYNFVTTNPDTGEKARIKGNIKVVQGEVLFDNFSATCVRDA